MSRRPKKIGFAAAVRRAVAIGDGQGGDFWRYELCAGRRTRLAKSTAFYVDDRDNALRKSEEADFSRTRIALRLAPKHGHLRWIR